jgi:hypothetical protein
LRRVGNITIQADVKVDANAFVDLPTVLWVAPEKVLGGNFGLGVIVPNGWKKVGVEIDALATLTLPPPLNITLQRGRHFDFDDSSTAFGDPLATALLGWQQGNWHWNIGALLNVPIGEWDKESISNIGFHRWAPRHHAGGDVARSQPRA